MITFPGDIVILTGGDGVPADMVILGSSQEQGFCHIETSNIDGETNLKVRQALPTVREWCEAAGIDPKDRATTLNKVFFHSSIWLNTRLV